MACPKCDPTLAPSGPRRDGNHFAGRFGAPDALLTVWKNGMQVHGVYEVEVPDRAWRYVYVDGSPVMCGHCGEGPWAVLDDSGGFSVRWGVPVASAS